MHNYSDLFRKRAVIVLAPVALLAIAGTLPAQVDLGLAPMRVEFSAIAGKPYSGALTLTNSGNAKTRVRVELLDLYVDDTMTPQFVPNAPAEAPYSCRSWLSVNPMELEMGPRSQVIARFTVRTPAGASERSFHCAIGFRTLPALNEAPGTAMLTAVRMIASIYPTVGKPSVSGEIRDLKLEQMHDDAGISWRAVVVMENSGLMLYRPTGDVELVDAQGKVIESQKLAAFPALPGRKQRYLLPLKHSLSPGPYTLRARIDVGAERQEASVAVTAEAPSMQAAAAAAPGDVHPDTVPPRP
jgi:hypothetical protein